jgi:hypothetical protein
MTIRKQVGTGSSRSHSGENSLWKRPWTCRRTDYGINDGPTNGGLFRNTLVNMRAEDLSFLDMTPRRLLNGYRRFGVFCHHLKGSRSPRALEP